MKREILFRGKQEHHKVWVYGHYFTEVGRGIDGSNDTIIYFIKDKFGTHPVLPETVGQYIWLKDKNKTKAFVGDIFIDAKGIKRTIMQDSGGFVTESNPTAFGYNTFPYEALSDEQNASWFSGTCKIIGNIFDNINLLTIKTNI